MRESKYNVWLERGGRHYVYNGMSGALLRIEPEEFVGLREFIDQQCSNPPVELLNRLVVGRMLVADDVDEIALLQRRYSVSRQQSEFLGLTLIPSLGCNFDCPYCFEDKHPSVMNSMVQSAIAQFVEDRLPKTKELSISWFGGEPLVGQKALFSLSKRLMRLCEKAAVRYSANITTNGYLLTEKTCERLKAANVKSAQVTLDGPPEIHDDMRPRLGGGPTFWQIVRNLRHAISYFPVAVRVNLDRNNVAHFESLFRLLAQEGLAGKLAIYPGQLFSLAQERGYSTDIDSAACMTKPEFSEVSLQFTRLSKQYGFDGVTLPTPTAAPCTAARDHDLVIGSNGELYKCWESIGDQQEVIGNICDYKNINGRKDKWIHYNPFSNYECQNCVALPVCMGGCANHAMNPFGYDNRCGVFRFNYSKRIADFIDQSSAS